MNSLTIFALLAVGLCCCSPARALPVDLEGAPQEPAVAGDEASVEHVEAIPISLLDVDVDGDALAALDGEADHAELQRSARGLGLGLGLGKFGGLGLGHGLKGFGGLGFGGLGFGGFHGFGGGLGLLKFKPFFHKFG